MPRYPYRILGNFFDRVFRNALNDNFKDIEADIKSQKERVDNLITNAEQPSEVVDSRTDKDGHVYAVLKDRLDAEQQQIENNTSEIKNRQLENIGVGVEEGLDVLASSTPDMNVHVQPGVIYMDDGTRYSLDLVVDVAVDPADGTNPRKDIIYVDVGGQVVYTAGTPETNPVELAPPDGAHKLCVIDVLAGDTEIEQEQITDTRTMKTEKLETLSGRVGDNSDLITIDKATLVEAINEVLSELNTHEEETASSDVHGLVSGGKIIEESGENENGRYIKFSDGTMICTAINNIDLSNNNDEDFPMPATFLSTGDIYYASCNVSVSPSLQTDREAAGSVFVRRFSNLWRVVKFGPTTTTWTNGAECLFIAIGRWK